MPLLRTRRHPQGHTRTRLGLEIIFGRWVVMWLLPPSHPAGPSLSNGPCSASHPGPSYWAWHQWAGNSTADLYCPFGSGRSPAHTQASVSAVRVQSTEPGFWWTGTINYWPSAGPWETDSITLSVSFCRCEWQRPQEVFRGLNEIIHAKHSARYGKY